MMKEEEVGMEIVLPKDEEEPIVQEDITNTAEIEAPAVETSEAEEPEKKARKRDKVLSSLVQDDDEESPRSLVGWKDIWNALNINGQWFRKQIGVIVLIVFCTIIYITNRYQAQQEIIDEELLRKEFQDWKFRSLTRNSELTLRTRQSKLEEQLKLRGDSTLKPNSDAKYRIVKEKK